MLDVAYETSIKNFTMIPSEFQNDVTIKGYKQFAYPTVKQETKKIQFGTETKLVVTFFLER